MYSASAFHTLPRHEETITRSRSLHYIHTAASINLSTDRTGLDSNGTLIAIRTSNLNAFALRTPLLSKAKAVRPCYDERLDVLHPVISVDTQSRV